MHCHAHSTILEVYYLFGISSAFFTSCLSLLSRTLEVSSKRKSRHVWQINQNYLFKGGIFRKTDLYYEIYLYCISLGASILVRLYELWKWIESNPKIPALVQDRIATLDIPIASFFESTVSVIPVKWFISVTLIEILALASYRSSFESEWPSK